MKISYDRAEDILMIELMPDGVIDHAEHSGPMISHFTADGKLVLLEILQASEFFSLAIKATVRGEPVELPINFA